MDLDKNGSDASVLVFWLPHWVHRERSSDKASVIGSGSRDTKHFRWCGTGYLLPNNEASENPIAMPSQKLQRLIHG